MAERRRRSRDRVYYGGLIAYGARASSLVCVVRNFNEFGAKIELGTTAIIPAEVDFVVERRQLACRARLIWRSPTAAGLKFCDPLKARSAFRPDRARKLKASGRADRQLPSRIEQLSSEPLNRPMTTDVAAGPSAHAACESITDVAPAPVVDPPRARGGRPLARVLRLMAAALTAQYVLIAIGTGLSVVATVKYVVTPQVIAKFEAVSAALKR